MAKDGTARVAVYVVWSSQLGAKEENIDEATTLIPDARVRHFWDPGRAVGTAYALELGTSAPAWDVWMLFPPDARWTDARVPEPAWWEHQLRSLPAERYLDPHRFAQKAAALERTLQ